MLSLLLIACSSDSPDESPLMLADLPGPQETRAGVIGDEALLFGGISAEGRVGDLMLVNDRVRFVVQGLRDSGFYMRQGGGVLDADVRRPSDQPGRDMVDDWATMVGFGRLVEPTIATVIDDGESSGTAKIRIEGPGTAMELVTGALESEALIPYMDLWITIDYTLPADSWFVEVTTTVTTESEEASLTVGDILNASLEASDAWTQRDGLDAPSGEPFEWTAFVGRRSEVALGIFSAPGQQLGLGTMGALLTSLAEVGLGVGEEATLSASSPLTHTRLYGVGPDLATLTDAWLARAGSATDVASGTVTAPDGPVEGARVTVLVDDAPYTLALTDADGHFSAQVPAGSVTTTYADGRGTGIALDLPPGAGSWSPYAAASVQEHVTGSYTQGAQAIPYVEGRGYGTAEAPLSLLEPGIVTVRSADGDPFEVRLEPWDVPSQDGRLVMDRASGDQIIGWARDGELSLVVEPGTYSLLVHRGVRHETWTQTLEVPAGSRPVLVVDLVQAWNQEGWWVADPHMHAAPSGDGSATMEQRLLAAAGVGLDLHFGTDHDHVADYRPLLAALGLSPWLTTVVADEVSPTSRGHLNLYPLVPTSEPNGGSYPYWTGWAATTDDQMAALRERHPGALIQSNHPLDAGMAGIADWSPGEIGKPDYWSEDFDVMEILNADDHTAYTELFVDLTNRGLHITPVGVSDSHAVTSGNPGLNTTHIQLGADYSDEGMVQALRDGRVVVSHGVGLDLSIDPGSTIDGPQDLTVQLLRASWIGVDSVSLLKNGEPVDTRTAELDAPLVFALAAEEDAWFSVVAEGSEPLAPVWSSETAWAFTSPIRLDLGGDGWTPPLPPLILD
jgi:hypothetical protein